MKTSTVGLELIKRYEGLSLNAYKDAVGIPTIGYGSIKYSNTGQPVKMGDTIVLQQANDELIEDIKSFENILNSLIKEPVNQNQFDALVALWFNCGGSNTIIKMINTKASKEDIYNWWISHYITAGGKTLKGLIRRRKEEADLFIK